MTSTTTSNRPLFSPENGRDSRLQSVVPVCLPVKDKCYPEHWMPGCFNRLLSSVIITRWRIVNTPPFGPVLLLFLFGVAVGLLCPEVPLPSPIYVVIRCYGNGCHMALDCFPNTSVSRVIFPFRRSVYRCSLRRCQRCRWCGCYHLFCNTLHWFRITHAVFACCDENPDYVRRYVAGSWSVTQYTCR